jgi:hypothetical protein
MIGLDLLQLGHLLKYALLVLYFLGQPLAHALHPDLKLLVANHHPLKARLLHT